MMHWSGGYGMGGLGWLLMFLFWALVFYVIATVFRHLACGRGQESSLEILRQRYARGELSRKEFERMTADLGGCCHGRGRG